MKIITTIILSFILLNNQSASAQRNKESVRDSLLWDTKNELPTPIKGTQHLGLAGAVIGISNDRLIVAGGANFPNGLPWQGGKKAFHKEIYVAQMGGENQLEWESVRPLLPTPLAYSANVPFQNGFITLGGEDYNGAIRRVSNWVWDEKKSNLVESKFPDLPKPLTNATAAVFNNHLYAIGGENQNGPSDAVWFLDLNQKGKGWQNGPKLPLATSHASAVVQANGDKLQLFLIGGRAKTATGVSDLYNQVLQLNTQEGKWINKSPITIGGQAIPALSAASTIASGSTYILVFGGDDGQIFHQIETYDQKINSAKSEEEKAVLKLKKNGLIENHKGFSKNVLLYNSITDSWTKLEDLPYSPVTTTAVKWREHIIIPSGEVQPGIRTPTILIGTPKAPMGMAWLDYAVIIGYLLLMVGIGIWTGRGQSSTDDYFKGGQKIPGWAAGLSIYGTQLSAITFMSIPAKTYATNWLYFILQLTIILIIPIITRYFIPFYRKLNITSAYEYLEQRFNYLVRAMGSLLYIMLQIGRLAIVLLLPSIALSVVTGVSVSNCILLMGVITIFYTMKGGITAVIWTDVAQVVILLGGALVCMILMILSINQPWSEVWTSLQEAGKIQIIDASFRFDSPTLWVVIIGGFAINIVSYGADQSVVQKLLTTKDTEESKKSIRLGAWMALPSAIIFFSIGTLLYLFYQQHPDRVNYQIESQDSIFPWFIVSELPPGVVGLLIAAVFAAAMSTLSSSINSVTTAITTDFYRRFNAQYSEKHYLNLAKIITLIIGCIGTGLALIMAKWGITSLWDQFNMILGLFTGGLGGVFLLGIFSTRTNAEGAVFGIIISALLQWIIKDYTSVHFLLYAATGLVSCIIFGYIFSFLFSDPGNKINQLTIHENPEI